MKWLIQVVVNIVVLMVVAGYFEGFYIADMESAIIAGILLTLINIAVKPILVILTLPVTIFSFGLFLFVINALTLLLTAKLMGDSFIINGFWMAVLAAIIISILTMLINSFIVKPLQKR